MDFKLTKGQSSKNKDNENNDNKVIRLNTRLTRRMQMRRELDQKKGATIASVLSLVALVTILNQNLISKNQSENRSRQIASAENEGKIKSWKEDLLKDLSDKKNRNIASYGEAPTALEQLRMGALEGKYSFSVKDSLVEVVKFIETPDGDRPKSFRDFTSFVSEHKKAFNDKIDRVVEVGEKSDDVQKTFTYETYTEANEPAGKILVVSDLSNRLLEIKYLKN